MTITNVTPPVVSGSTVQGSTLHSTPGTWTSPDPLTYAYQWERCDGAGANCSDIAGATSSSYILAAADVGHTMRARVTATAVPTPPPNPPPSGVLIFNGNLETGDDSQYDGYASLADPDRFRVCTTADGVDARRGYMARVECRQREATNWASNLSATLIIKAGLPVGIGQTYTDTYLGWSAYIPSDWPWASGAAYGMHSIFVEWHGTGSMSQAPFHWGIRWDTGCFFIDLHRAITGYSPVFQPSFDALSDPGMADTWHDYVMRIKWSSGSDGVATFWRDGVQLFNWTGATSPLSGERIKFQAGAYVANTAPASKVLYLDEMRLGTTYAVVDPTRY